jgi:bacteriorhodopsin
MQRATLFLLLVCAVAANKVQQHKSKAVEEDPSVLSENGYKILWGAFAGLFLPTLYFCREMFKLPEGNRKYHCITMFITLIASLAYLTMASGHGVYVREFDGRQFYYARYIDWAFTTPLMLLEICAFGGASSDTTNWLLGVDFLMIIAGLIGAFLEGTDKYYFWVFGMLMFAPIIHALIAGLKESSATKSESCQKVFKQIAMLTAVTWSCYPIVWLAAEGTGSITVDQETICYTILDLLAKSVFGIIIIGARNEHIDGSL